MKSAEPAASLGNLGLVALAQGLDAEAIAYQEESLALYRERGDIREMSVALHELGDTVCRQGDYALVGVAALVTLNAAGRCERVRLALCGVGPTALRAREAEQLLLGELPAGDALAAAAERAAAASDPPGDVHASAHFRRRLARVTTRQAIALAAQRAGGA